MIRRLPLLMALSAALLLGACGQYGGTEPATVAAQAAAGEPSDPSDPYERLNRQVLDVNLALDDAAFRPIALFYRDITNPWLRDRIHNALQNVNEPGVLVNNLLQGRPVDAGRSLLRFVLNSTVGVGGLWDIGASADLPQQTRDFGQTLYVWGIGDGPYLMLPFAGPSTARDMAGLIVNGFLNPVNWFIPIGPGLGAVVIGGVDQRERNVENLDELRSGSLDFYARLRSVWRQHRDEELGRTTQEGIGLGPLDDPGAPPAPAAPAAPAPGPRSDVAPPNSRVPMRATARPVS